MPNDAVLQELQRVFGEASVRPQATHDGRDEITTFWAPSDKAREMLRYLKTEVERPYRFLYDLTAIDERVRADRGGAPASDFTVVYHLLDFGTVPLGAGDVFDLRRTLFIFECPSCTATLDEIHQSKVGFQSASELEDEISVLANTTGLCTVPRVHKKTVAAAKRAML